ncbi:CATRA conflict system CASPASE/TPR repeat-associated protein [Micromonosporaceae bacterium Da 78-11]
MGPRRPALVRHTFLPVADLGASELADYWALVTAGMDLGVDGWPTDPGPGSGTYAAIRRRRLPGGLHEAAVYRLHDVIGVGVLLAPNDDRKSWRELDGAFPPAPAGALGTATIYAGQWRGRRDPARLREHLPGDGRTGAWSRTGNGVLWCDLPAGDDAHRRLLAMSDARDEAAMDRLLWIGDGRTLPPLTRYLLQAARLRHQQRVLTAALPGLRAAGERTEKAGDVLAGLLRGRDPAVTELRAADEALGLARAEQGGLITATADVQDMAATVRAARGNLVAALTPADADLGVATWLDQQLAVELTYLESARRKADELTRLAGAVVDEWRRRRQESLTLLQTSILGGLLMALAAVQSLTYRVPVPRSVVAPLIAVLAGLAVLLPAALTRRPIGRGLQLGAGLLGGAVGWLAAATTYRLALGVPAPVGWSVGAAVTGAALSVAATEWLRRRKIG